MIQKKIALVIFACFLFSCTKSFKEADLYINKLVYLKKDSTLFTGILRVSDDASYYNKSFCKGIPCGEWGEYETNGGVVNKGNYLDKAILSEATQDLIGSETFLINYWQESELPTITYPPFLTVIILKNDAFFHSDKKQNESDIRQLAYSVVRDTRNMKYDFLTITFVNAVHSWNMDYTKEYNLENGKLQDSEKD